MRRVLMVIGLLAACVPQLATAEPSRPAHVESVHVPPAAEVDSVDTVRIAVVAHIPLPDSLVADTIVRDAR
jgi:hypothetical protein